MFADGTQAGDGHLRVVDAAAATDVALAERAAEIERQRTALDAEQVLVLGELDALGTCDREFGLSTGGWLAREARLPIGPTKARVKVAAKLRRHLPLVAAALVEGRISWEHARVLADLANPRIVDTIAEHQEMLLGLADGCRFEVWRAEVRALGRMWDEDGGYDPNEDPTANRLSYGTTLDGLLSVAGTFTGENGEVLRQDRKS